MYYRKLILEEFAMKTIVLIGALHAVCLVLTCSNNGVGAFRTLSNDEASNIIGGLPGYRCGVIAACNVTGPYFCNSASSASCDRKEESVPISSANNMACNIPDTSVTDCLQSINLVDCNITYQCDWSTSSNICYRTTTSTGASVSAPSYCTPK